MVPGGGVTVKFSGFSVGGRPIEMECRTGTHDYATCAHLLGHDEYGLRGLSLPAYGLALDIGAYIGTLSIALAADGWDVIAVEPLEENREMIFLNAELNGVTLTVDARAASHVGWVDIPYGFRGDHYYVGGLSEKGTKTTRVEGASVSDLMETYEVDRIDLLKIDCEGCEWDVLSDIGAQSTRVIVGEIHGRTQKELRQLLPHHEVQFISQYVFRAVL